MAEKLAERKGRKAFLNTNHQRYELWFITGFLEREPGFLTI